MLALRRAIRINGVEAERTPLLVPSFSSKGFPDADKVIRTTSEVIDGPALVSAYDIWHKKITPPFDFATLLFLDSGGYEAGKDVELSDVGDRVITHAIDGWFQAPMVLRMVPKGLRPARRAVSTTVRMSASPSAAHIAR
jgi:hypothetical protein